MTAYLIDTNIISELRKGDRTNEGVRKWFDRHATDEIWLSVLVVAEIHRGTELLRRRDELAAAQLEKWLDALTASYADRILPVDLAIARRWARLGIPDPLPVVDALLAATALQHNLTLVTRNEGEMRRTGALLENPFT